MNGIALTHSYTIGERFDRTVKMLRRALAETELNVLQEFDTTRWFREQQVQQGPQSRVLLVDCPLLFFEAQALSRAAGVFLPLHILLCADGAGTRVFLSSATELFDCKVPLGAAGPIERLQARVALALDSVTARADANHRKHGVKNDD